MFKLPSKLLVAAASTLLLCACQTTPMSFGIPSKQFNQLTPAQKKVQIKKYNAEQAERKREEPLFHSLEAIAGAALQAHPVGTSHCHQSAPKPVCHTNPDGSRTCTASGSGSCSGFSID